MAISIDWATKVISVPQADLTFVSGTTYDLDTDTFRLALKALEASSDGMAFVRTNRHNTEVGPIVGVTYARTIEIINGYTVTFEDTGSAYTIRMQGSNNNIFDVDGGVLNPTALVTIVSNNSAGLVATGVSGLTPAESAALLAIDTKITTLLSAQNLTNEQLEAETTTDPILGLVIKRNTTVMRRWEATAWEDSLQTIPYSGAGGAGIESVGMLVEVAWS